MDSVPVPRKLGKRGLGLVLRSLKDGHVVSDAFLAGRNLTSGDAVAYLPAELPLATLWNHGFGAEVAAASREQALRAIAAFGPDHFLVVEDESARLSDPWLQGDTSHWAIGSQVLHYGTLAGRDPASVRALIGRASSMYPLNAFVISRARLDLPTPRQASAEQLARAAEAVITAAFDAEILIVWIPHRHI